MKSQNTIRAGWLVLLFMIVVGCFSKCNGQSSGTTATAGRICPTAGIYPTLLNGFTGRNVCALFVDSSVTGHSLVPLSAAVWGLNSFDANGNEDFPDEYYLRSLISGQPLFNPIQYYQQGTLFIIGPNNTFGYGCIYFYLSR